MPPLQIDFRLPPRISKVAAQIHDAARTTIAAYKAGLISHEPQITERWMGAIDNTVRSPRTSSQQARSTGQAISWRAKTLTSGPGRAAEESRHGADLLGVAEVVVDGRVSRKGFLAQAKRVEPGTPLNVSEWDRLQSQCEIMLKRTPASYVLAYSQFLGIAFLPALSVLSFDRRDLFEFNHISTRKFFEWHLAGFIGDPRLKKPDIETLDGLIGDDSPDDFVVRNVLYIEVVAHAIWEASPARS
jgi:hypothetical protein